MIFLISVLVYAIVNSIKYKEIFLFDAMLVLYGVYMLFELQTFSTLLQKAIIILLCIFFKIINNREKSE